MVTLPRQSRKDWAMKNAKSPYHGHRFPAAVISYAVRWYQRLSDERRTIEQALRATMEVQLATVHASRRISIRVYICRRREQTAAICAIADGSFTPGRFCRIQ
jgi:transposase-like protein